MEITALCAVVASLGVFPNRSQFFKYENVSFSMICGNTSQWNVKRNTSRHINQLCPSCSDRKCGCNCCFDHLYETDSGVYWWESEAGELSNAINITVTSGAVILQSPAFPVMERETVTLLCKTRTTSSENLITEFYKDELLIESSSTGNMTLQSVSKSDEGLYKCHISGVGESPNSWLTVTAGLPELQNSTPTLVVLPVMAAVASLILVTLLCLWRSHEDKFYCTVVMYTGNTRTHRRCTGGLFLRKRSSSSLSVAVYRPEHSPALVRVYKASSFYLDRRKTYNQFEDNK